MQECRTAQEASHRQKDCAWRIEGLVSQLIHAIISYETNWSAGPVHPYKVVQTGTGIATHRRVWVCWHQVLGKVQCGLRWSCYPRLCKFNAWSYWESVVPSHPTHHQPLQPHRKTAARQYVPVDSFSGLFDMLWTALMICEPVNTVRYKLCLKELAVKEPDVEKDWFTVCYQWWCACVLSSFSTSWAASASLRSMNILPSSFTFLKICKLLVSTGLESPYDRGNMVWSGVTSELISRYPIRRDCWRKIYAFAYSSLPFRFPRFAFHWLPKERVYSAEVTLVHYLVADKDGVKHSEPN